MTCPVCARSDGQALLFLVKWVSPEPETHVKVCGRCARGVPDLGMGIGLSFEFAQEDTPTSAVAKVQHTTIYLRSRIEAHGYRTLMD